MEFWANSINNSCTKQDIDLAHECTSIKEAELNEKFFNIFPKMFANILLQLKDLKMQNKTLTKEQEVGYQVIEYLGRETLGANKFIKMVKDEVANQKQSQDEEQASL